MSRTGSSASLPDGPVVITQGMADASRQSLRIIGPGAATLGVVAASVGFGFVPFFARALMAEGMAPHAVAFFRYALTALVLSPFVWQARHKPRPVLWGVLAGIVMALGWIGYVRAVEQAPVGTVGVLYMTYPIFTMLIAWGLFGDRPSRRAIAAGLTILVAAALGSSGAVLGPGMIWPLVISLAAPLGFGFGICVLVHRLPELPPLARIASVSLGSVIGLAPLMLASAPAGLVPGSMQGWLLVAGIALGSALVPQLIYTICSPVIGTARTATAGAVELPTMFLLGWIAFGEPIGALQWVACAMIVTAIAMTPTRITRNVATHIARR